jgi:ubiquinone biosynthesis protein
MHRKESRLHSKTVDHLGRFKDIAVALLRFGFDDIVERLDLPGKELLEKNYRAAEPMTTWKRLRLLLVELGPSFIKIGQILSLRPDILPTELVIELRKLQDEVAPEPFDAIRTVVEQELDAPLKKIFSFFDPQPLAGASLSQVHRAVLRDGRHAVAVKVQRPGIEEIIATDLDILQILADQVHERMARFVNYNLPDLAKEIRRTLSHEIDFLREARHMRIVGNNFAGEASVKIPQVYEDFCTGRVLTMELVTGVHLKDLDGLAADKKSALASTGLRLMIKQVLEDGFFHADPHPGNVLILDGSVFCLLDWGMVGRLTPASRLQVLDLIEWIIARDSEELTENILNLARSEERVDRQQLERELLEVLDTYHSLPLSKINLGRLLLEISDIVRENRLHLPVDLAIMIKAMVTAEGTARQLDPRLNIITEAEPIIRRIAQARWQPQELLRQTGRLLRHYARLHRRLPARLDDIIDKLVSGRMAVRFKHENLSELCTSLENASSRLTSGVVIGALIIGSSMIITTGVKPLLFGYPALGIVGYLVSGIVGLWLVYNIIRSRKL